MSSLEKFVFNAEKLNKFKTERDFSQNDIEYSYPRKLKGGKKKYRENTVADPFTNFDDRKEMSPEERTYNNETSRPNFFSNTHTNTTNSKHALRITEAQKFANNNSNNNNIDIHVMEDSAVIAGSASNIMKNTFSETRIMAESDIKNFTKYSDDPRSKFDHPLHSSPLNLKKINF